MTTPFSRLQKTQVRTRQFLLVFEHDIFRTLFRRAVLINNFCLKGPFFTFLALVFLTQELFKPPRGGGGEGIQKSFVQGRSAPRSNPLPSYIVFLTENVPLSYTFYRKRVPLSYAQFRTLNTFYQEPIKWSLHLPYKPLQSTLSRVDL